MLLPNNKQKTKLFQCAGVARWAYNWTLGRQKENYELGGSFISDSDLRKELTQLKKIDEYQWLNKYSNNITKQAIKDACDAYKRFFKGYSKFPRFKSKKKSEPKFYQDNIKIQFTETHVKLEKLTDSKKANKQKLNWIRLAEKNRIPFGKDVKYVNPRISFDGLNWWVSVGIEYHDVEKEVKSEAIGIDLGIKEFAVISNGTIYKNVNKTSKVRKVKKKLERLQRQISRKYEKNKDGNKFIKTKNIVKAECKLKKIHKRLYGIRNNKIHHITSSLVKTKPEYIVIEDLNVKGMMKNKYLAKAVQEQCLGEFKRQLEYKCEWNQVKLIIADKWFPSSKLCSSCGQIKKDLKLSDRVYECDCGNVIDRDLNAAINLKNYGKKSA